MPLGGTGAEAEHWHGLSVAGVLTRTTADTALLMSVLTSGALPAEVTEPGPLRIAWTVRAPVRTPVHPAVERALHHALELLRGLGHAVERRDPDYRGVQPSFLARYARGAHDDLVRLADPSATEPRTRLVGAVGGRISDTALARAVGWGDRAAERLATLPGSADVLVTPTLAAPPRAIGSLDGLRAVALAGGVVPFTPAWNVTGQPAVSVPVGSTSSGLPLAVQLVGRPDSEALLLGLASSLERLISWSARRPPLDGEQRAPGDAPHPPR